MTDERYGDDLARIHHEGFGGLAREAAPWVVAELRRAGIDGGTVVELGCGSGILLAALAEAGYRAVGIDASAPMLEIAATVAPEAVLRRGSLYEVDLPPCRAIVAMGEPLSYVADPEAVPTTAELFDRAATALAPGGLLLFDVMIRGPEPPEPYRTWAEGEGWVCRTDVRPVGPAGSEGAAIERSITTFRRIEGDTWRRIDEGHFAFLFSCTKLIQELESAGFRVRLADGYGPARLAPGRKLLRCVAP